MPTTALSLPIPTVHVPPPAPDAVRDEEAIKMGSFLSSVKIIMIPGIIVLIFYLLISCVLLPIWRRYRSRHFQNMPFDNITSRTLSIRSRARDAAYNLLIPRSWRENYERSRIPLSRDSASFDEDNGEELFEVDDARREALSLDANRGRHDGQRLSRDLEEGFKDDSDTDEMDTEGAHGSSRI